MPWLSTDRPLRGAYRRMQSSASGRTIPLPAAPAEATGGAPERHANRLAYGLLVLVAGILPFEVPLFHLGPLQITTVELALYALLAAWGLVSGLKIVRDPTALRSSVGDLLGDPLTRAAVLWVAVLFASTAAAPLYRAAAFKFALRSTSGVLAFFAARTLARTPLAIHRVLLALTAGAIVSATTALVDALVPSSVTAWSFFREGTFDTFGLERASGVFAYPTMGAMYWEAAIPLLVVAPFLRLRSRSDRASTKDVAVALGGCAILLGAILASATRSGLAGASVACGMFLWFGRELGPSVRRVVLGVLAILVAWSSLALVARGGSNSLLGQRLRWWDDGRWFGAEYALVGAAPGSVGGETTFQVPMVLRNTGALTWRAREPHPVRLAYHWEPLGRAATVSDFEGLRTDLPQDVPPGRETKLVATVRTPKAVGPYHLRWDLVQEDVTWFSERGNAMPEQSVSIEGPSSEVLPTETPQRIAAPPPPVRSQLWRAAVRLWRERPLLGVGPDNFRRRYEAVLSPSPTGQAYSDTRLHANSLYFETLADLGLSGIAALAAIGVALLGALREHFAARRLAAIGCAVAAALFFVHGVLDYFLEFTPLFGLFWILLGLTSAARRASLDEVRQGSRESARAR
jgi:hypothetical protein